MSKDKKNPAKTPPTDPNKDAQFLYPPNAPIITDHFSVNSFGDIFVINCRCLLPEILNLKAPTEMTLNINLLEINPHTRLALTKEGVLSLKKAIDSIVDKNPGLFHDKSE